MSCYNKGGCLRFDQRDGRSTAVKGQGAVCSLAGWGLLLPAVVTGDTITITYYVLHPSYTTYTTSAANNFAHRPALPLPACLTSPGLFPPPAFFLQPHQAHSFLTLHPGQQLSPLASVLSLASHVRQVVSTAVKGPLFPSPAEAKPHHTSLVSHRHHGNIPLQLSIPV